MTEQCDKCFSPLNENGEKLVGNDLLRQIHQSIHKPRNNIALMNGYRLLTERKYSSLLMKIEMLEDRLVKVRAKNATLKADIREERKYFRKKLKELS